MLGPDWCCLLGGLLALTSCQKGPDRAQEAREATVEDVLVETLQVKDFDIPLSLDLWPEKTDTVTFTCDANSSGKAFLERLLGVTLEPTVFCEGCSGYRLIAQPTDEERREGIPVPPDADPDDRAIPGLYVRNHWFDRRNGSIRTVVLHGTCFSLPHTLAVFTRKEPVRVGAHYVVTTKETLVAVFPNGEERKLVVEPGIVLSIVPEEHVAYHAGMSFWQGEEKLNVSSIGIELVNRTNDEPHWNFCSYPSEQIEAVVRLVKHMTQRYKIPPTHVVGHGDVSPSRKTDPWLLFPWETLFAKGLGMGLNSDDKAGGDGEPIPNSITLNDMAPLLRSIGYTGPSVRDSLEAFRLHFWPLWTEGGRALDNEHVRHVYARIYQKEITREEYVVLKRLAAKFGRKEPPCFESHVP